MRSHMPRQELADRDWPVNLRLHVETVSFAGQLAEMVYSFPTFSSDIKNMVG